MADIKHRRSLIARIGQRLGSVMVGGVLLLYGVIFVWHGIPHTDSVTCERKIEAQIDCQRQQKVLGWIPIKNTQLNQLRSVQMGNGENFDDSTVYFIVLRGENRHLSFGHTLNSAEIQLDRLKLNQFLHARQPPSVRVERYEAHWFFAVIGLPIGALGLWTLIYRNS